MTAQNSGKGGAMRTHGHRTCLQSWAMRGVSTTRQSGFVICSEKKTVAPAGHVAQACFAHIGTSA